MAKKIPREVKDIPPDIYETATWQEWRDEKTQTLYLWLGEPDGYFSSTFAAYVDLEEKKYVARITKDVCRLLGDIEDQSFSTEKEAKKYILSKMYEKLEVILKTLKKVK